VSAPVLPSPYFRSQRREHSQLIEIGIRLPYELHIFCSSSARVVFHGRIGRWSILHHPVDLVPFRFHVNVWKEGVGPRYRRWLAVTRPSRAMRSC
jgi:hypothetical protein